MKIRFIILSFFHFGSNLFSQNFQIFFFANLFRIEDIFLILKHTLNYMNGEP